MALHDYFCSMELLQGKTASKAIKEDLKEKISTRLSGAGRSPHLVAILIGNDPASETYVNSKVKNCNEVGMRSTLLRWDTSVSEQTLLNKLQELNEEEDVDGILVQVPLPEHISESKVTLTISPEKDVDGFHPLNLGNMVLGLPAFVSATPLGIMHLLDHYKIETEGKRAVVVGRSNNLGTPVSLLLSRHNRNATVTLCHSRTRDLAAVCREADILIAAIGKAGIITEDMVKPGAVVIDVGINRVPDVTKKKGYSLKGDVDFENVSLKCSFITPVPGGVGPMTIAALLTNTYDAWNRKYGHD